MSFQEYLHIENLNNIEVEGILKGYCHLFSKLDGTNGSLWSDNGVIKAGSRKRELSILSDNAGFNQWTIHCPQIRDFFAASGDRYRLFGEWLVPHYLRTYLDEAWRKFYIFDVYDRQKHKYLPHVEYKTILDPFGLNVIPCTKTVLSPTQDYLTDIVNSNDYLIKEGFGLGEGIVIKNYDFINKYGRFTYAKIVRNECRQRQGKIKQKNHLQENQLEEIIIDKHITSMVCNKAYAKIVNETDGWSSKHIGRLLNTVFHDLVVEETWNILKKFKNPTIDFKHLQRLCTQKIKELKSELF